MGDNFQQSFNCTVVIITIPLATNLGNCDFSNKGLHYRDNDLGLKLSIYDTFCSPSCNVDSEERVLSRIFLLPCHAISHNVAWALGLSGILATTICFN